MQHPRSALQRCPGQVGHLSLDLQSDPVFSLLHQQLHNFANMVATRFSWFFKCLNRPLSKELRHNTTERLRTFCILINIVLIILSAFACVTFVISGMKIKDVWDVLSDDLIDEENALIMRVHTKDVVPKDYGSVDSMIRITRSLNKETICLCGFIISACVAIEDFVTYTALMWGLFARRKVVVYLWLFASSVNTIAVIVIYAIGRQFETLPPQAACILLWLEVELMTSTFKGLVLWYLFSAALEERIDTISSAVGDKSNSKSYVVKAYGGYNHTVNPPLLTNPNTSAIQDNDQKQIV